MTVERHARRPVLILIPGLLNDGDLWRDQIAALSGEVDCRVADTSRGRSLRELAYGVLAMTSGTFALAGFSLGGFIAQEVMRLAPSRVARLALLDTSIRADSPERAQQRVTLNAAALTAGKFHGFGDRLLISYLHESNRGNPDIVARIRAMTERLGPEVFVRQNGLPRPDGSDVLKALECPVLIACGTDDQITPLAGHKAMMALIPAGRGTFAEIPNSGHMTPLENPQAVTAALYSWLFPQGR